MGSQKLSTKHSSTHRAEHAQSVEAFDQATSTSTMITPRSELDRRYDRVFVVCSAGVVTDAYSLRRRTP